MLEYIWKRLLLMVPVVIGLSFILLHYGADSRRSCPIDVG